MVVMRRIFLLFLLMYYGNASAQMAEAPLKIFGYFQSSFNYEYQENPSSSKYATTFNLQQLNVFLQKDLAKNWTAFVNVELLNNFSSSRDWGALNLEEAWLRYRSSKEFNLKLGLQIPIFNELNEIKNRTPILPYIIRPLVYETSFNEFIAIEEFLPGRAYVQTFGYIPVSKLKVDYALYLGNSPNINKNSLIGQTGVDTTGSMLVGGRIGLRTNEFRIGFSGTYDRTNLINLPIMPLIYGGPRSRYEEIPRIRYGGDLSFNWHRFSLKGEFIQVNYDDDVKEIHLSKEFYYLTLGYYLTDQLFLYGSYWLTEENVVDIHVEQQDPLIYQQFSGELSVKVPTAGLAYNFSDRITMKAQVAEGKVKCDCPNFLHDEKMKIATVAVSVFF